MPLRKPEAIVEPRGLMDHRGSIIFPWRDQEVLECVAVTHPEP